MSLWHAYFQGNQVFVCADSRVSARVMEKSYYVTDKYKKIRVIGNKVIFVSGNVEVDQQLFNLIKADSSIRFIQRKVKKLYNEYNKKISLMIVLTLRLILSQWNMEKLRFTNLIILIISL